MTNPDGSKGEDFKGTIMVSEAGEVASAGDNGRAQIRHANGDETMINPDQSQVTKDINCRVTDIELRIKST